MSEDYKKQSTILAELGSLYHKYSFFGVDNDQLPGIYALNQKAKEPIIVAYIAYAFAKCKHHTSDAVSFTELFCADGFYAMIAARLGYERSIGIDNDKDGHFRNAKLIAELLGIRNVEFYRSEIDPDSIFEPTDVVANIGGLYHVNNPNKILAMSYTMAKRYLIVQSVVNLATDNENYFESPAPGWTWGNRFSRKSFDKMIKELGYNVIDCHFNELEGNDRLEDRGSVYYLIQK